MKTCTIHQWLWSRAGESGLPAPVWSGRHMARCAVCREAVASVVRLDGTLRAGAQPPAAPPGFDVRVMAALREAAGTAGRPAAASLHGWRRPAWAAVAASLAVAIAFWAEGRMTRRASALAEARTAMSAAVAASDWIAAWGDAAPDRLTAPMQAEIDNLIDDARRAASVLLAGLD